MKIGIFRCNAGSQLLDIFMKHCRYQGGYTDGAKDVDILKGR